MTTIYVIMLRDMSNDDCCVPDTFVEAVDPCEENVEEVLARYEADESEFDFYYAVKAPL